MQFSLSLLFSLLFFVLHTNPIQRVAAINAHKERAAEAFAAGDYQKAAELYTQLLDSFQVRDHEVLLNLAHAHFEAQQPDEARKYYRQVAQEMQALSTLRSVAHQQLGVLQAQEKKPQEALESFKEALRAEPTNEEARFNYELLKKMIEQQQEQDKQDDKDKQDKQDEQEKNDEQQENKDQESQDEQQDQEDGEADESKDQQSENSEQQESEQNPDKPAEEQKPKDGERKQQEEPSPEQQQQQQRMEEIKMTPEQAEMLLNALRNQEIQYYQQMKKQNKTKQDPNRPDW